MLINRVQELETLVGCVERAHLGGSAVLVGGEPGIGKSALLDEVRRVAAARGFRVLSARAVPFEAQLPYAALHLLLQPLLGGIDRLPPAQRDALRAAFGLSDRTVPDPFLTALATLDLLCEHAADAPLLVLLDDAHWIDAATADVLAFVARRVDADAVVLIAALRDGHPSVLREAGCPVVRLDGLSEREAAALLDRHAPGLPADVHARVMRDSAGNPLALIELPVALRASGGAPGPLPPARLPVTERLERAFAARLAELPPAARTLLSVAAADESATLAEVLEASATLLRQPATVRDAAPAAACGLVDVDETRLRFRHPLMRSAIYESLPLHERIEVHAALAAVLALQPDRRAWHRACAAVAGDEEVAAELEQAAERAQRRGAGALALAALQRAVELSATAARRGERLLRIAELAYQLGRPDVLLRTLDELQHAGGDASLAPRVAWLRHFFRESAISTTAEVGPLVDAADRMRRDGAVERALASLQMVSMRLWWENPDREARLRALAVADRMPVDADHPTYVATVALTAPVERGAFVLERISRVDAHAHADGEARYLLGLAGTGVGAFAEAKRHLDAAVAALRGEGRPGLLAQALTALTWTDVLLGRWTTATIAGSEAARLAREHGQPLRVVVAEAAEAAAAAYRGDAARAEQLAGEVERTLVAAGAMSMVAMVHLTRGAAALTDGRHAEACAHLRHVLDPADPAYHPPMRSWVLADYVEAMRHADRVDEARAVVAEMEAEAEVSRSPLLRAALAFARPMVAGEADAERAFLAGLAAPLGDWPFLQARLHLAFGAWLRRGRRVAESRAPLRSARDTFAALGAAPWAERAVRELRAAGEASRSRRPDPATRLSAQELQIALMAADGLSNKEIGRQLFLSHRTVASHLYRVFPKLGITTRAQLRKALRQPEPA